MRMLTAFGFLAALAVGTAGRLGDTTRATASQTADARSALPPLEASYPLPPLPERSLRNANYTIEARLDPAAHTLEGKLILEWRNTSSQPLSTFPFHLYWNAFRNNLSTAMREREERRTDDAPEDQARRLGYLNVLALRWLSASETDLMPTLRYVQPDDGNADDRTVMEVDTPRPVLPGETARFAIEWNARIPGGDVGRSGWVHDYHFIAQWFPKIGVFWKGAWNCHQFHAHSEFFADYGVYDVRLTLPSGFIVGATGMLQGEPTVNPDGSRTFRFVQEDVHDFAWVAGQRLQERRGRFEDPGYPPVEIRALVQPEHIHQAERLIEATKVTLRSYGAWSAPYPYPQITVVDPAWGSSSGGMEYPTLFTAGSWEISPPALLSPEGVTIHEAGHQFWYALVGNNEFEEAWLDEGITTYHTAKAQMLAYGPEAMSHRYFGPDGHSGWPLIAPGLFYGRAEPRGELRALGKADVMARKAWEYRSGGSYGLNSYLKPALVLQTLEGLVGDETMTRILRTYGRRYRFAHPTSEDFVRTVNEVTGQDWRWFFDRTFFSSDLVDYAVTVSSQRPRALAGYTDGRDGRPVLASPPPSPSAAGWESEVVIERRGEVRMPVELLVQFSDGQETRETWNGEDRWARFRYARPAKIRRAVIDPEGKLALDIDPTNNSWVEERGEAKRAATKWAARFLLWLENLLEIHMLLG